MPRSGRETTLSLLAGASLISLLASFGSSQLAIATQDAGASSTAATNPTETAEKPMQFESRTQVKEERKKKLNMTALHRLDYRVTGSSCAACLGRIRKRIDKEKGVYEVAVAIKPPYGVAVIYDSTKTNKDKLLEAAKKDEKLDVYFHDMEDVKVDKEPMIIVPKFNSLVKPH